MIDGILYREVMETNSANALGYIPPGGLVMFGLLGYQRIDVSVLVVHGAISSSVSLGIRALLLCHSLYGALGLLETSAGRNC
jgi:hypothetical protein